MQEIRIHGRGGQGSLVLAQFMAIAALEDDRYGLPGPQDRSTKADSEETVI